MYKITFDSLAKKELINFDRSKQKRIISVIEEKLTSKPELYGKPLRQSLRNYRSLRIGDQRLVFKITEKKVFILAIGHRGDVYEEAVGRLSP